MRFVDFDQPDFNFDPNVRTILIVGEAHCQPRKTRLNPKLHE